MTKKISNLRENVLKVAAELFRENEYNNVDMRRIAKEIGIAVGTIYNYFPNKETIYVEVFKASWDKTLENLDKITMLKKNPVEKAIDFVMEIYKGKEERKYLSKEVIFHAIKKSKGRTAVEEIRNQWHKEILNKMKIILNEVATVKDFGIDSKYYEDLTTTMIISVLTIENFTDDIKKKKEFIEIYIKKLLS